MDFSVLKQLVEINSWTKNKVGVDLNGEIMKSLYGDIGYQISEYKREDIGNHLYFKTKFNSKNTRLLLLGHLDTVFPPETFTQFKEDAEWVYGPGVCDMKGGNFIAYCALKNIFQKYGHVYNIDVLLVSDEETGSDDSKKLSQEIALNYDECIDFEAAGKNMEIVVARKGIATFKLNFEGKAAHAGNHYTEGKNANLAAAKALIALTDLTCIEKGTTVNAGVIKGGIGANTIAPASEILVEARFESLEEKNRVLRDIDLVVEEQWVSGVSCKLSGGVQRDVMVETNAQKAFIKKIEKKLGYVLKKEKRGGVSDANVFAEKGVTTLDGFGPFGDGDHTVHERANKKSFTQRINESYQIFELYQI